MTSRSAQISGHDLVLAAVRESGPISRAELIRRTGMARETVNAVLTGLLAEEALAEGDPVPSARQGRPARLLSLGPAAGVVVGVIVDTTGARVEVASLAGEVETSASVPLDLTVPADALNAVAAAVREAVGEQRVWITTLGLPAPMAGGVVQPSSVLPKWAGLAPATELRRRLGHRVIAANDADLGVLGEVAHGVAAGHRDVCYLRVESGIGCGLLMGGRLHRGATGVAGEIGHVQVDETGVLCRCGNRGCLETIAAPRELLAALETQYGESVDAARALELAGHDPIAQRVLADAGRMIGRVIADLANTVNPSIVVLDGPLIAEGGPVVAGVREALRRYAQPEVADRTEVHAGSLAGRAGVLGAIAAGLSRLPAARPAPDRRSVIVSALRSHGPMTRSDLVKLTRLPRAATGDLLAAMESDGVVAAAEPPSRSGRPSPAYRLVTPPELLAGAAISADGVRAVIADADGRVLHSTFAPLPLSLAARPPVREAAGVVRALLSEHGRSVSELRAVGLSVPAPVDPVTGRFGTPGVLPTFTGFAPADEVTELLGVPCVAANNASLAALAESRRGAAAGARDVLYLRADQYTGGGILAEGRPYPGAHGFAGEVGHLNVREVGPLCICGSRGCLSTFLAPGAFQAILAGAPGLHDDVTPPDVRLLELSDAGHRPAQRALLDAGRLIGRSVAPLCNVLNPAVVVVGGRYTLSGSHVVDGVRESLMRHCAPAATAGLRVVATALARDAEVLGAIESLLPHR
ncbi:ROK family protein [Actinoplanes bogorensis]|uniref:ROK family protein n=1 Tax=Paractinoplanes bogorensis TaxID=1610840 RepID=A0ABS5Z074_9ACTN|nr:ROK family protein [Actinoplanes bogorensis]MBU2669088.1 ROK family protein [Actinoplanes bogorensis]